MHIISGVCSLLRYATWPPPRLIESVKKSFLIHIKKRGTCLFYRHMVGVWAVTFLKYCNTCICIYYTVYCTVVVCICKSLCLTIWHNGHWYFTVFDKYSNTCQTLCWILMWCPMNYELHFLSNVMMSTVPSLYLIWLYHKTSDIVSISWTPSWRFFLERMYIAIFHHSLPVLQFGLDWSITWRGVSCKEAFNENIQQELCCVCLAVLWRNFSLNSLLVLSWLNKRNYRGILVGVCCINSEHYRKSLLLKCWFYF